jgi:hypothetical protein
MSKGSTTRTTQTSTPIIPEYLQTAQEGAFGAASAFAPQVYEGARYVEPTPFEQQQLAALGEFGGGQGIIPGVEQAVGGVLAGGVGAPTLLQQEYERDLSPAYLEQVIQDRLSDVTGDITSQYAMGGRLGSAAFGTALGRGIGSSIAPLLAQQEVADAERRMQLAGQISEAERQAGALQLTAAGVAPTAQDLQLQRLQALGQAGALERATGMLPIEAEQARIAEENAAAQARLNAMLSAAGVSVPAGQTIVSQEPRPGIGTSLLGVGSILSGIGGLGNPGYIGGLLGKIPGFGG